MDRDKIKSIFQDLAMSQGFYGRLLESIEEMDEEKQEEFWKHLEDQCFEDSVDLILYIEG